MLSITDFFHLRLRLNSQSLTNSLFASVFLLGAFAPAWGQSPVPITTPTITTQLATSSGPRWGELSPSQQKVLGPLAPSWDFLEAARKRKWMAVAQTYSQLAPEEQAKLQARMVEWSALSPNQRSLARLNYSASKKVSASDRAAEWDAYQALPPEDRQKYVAKAASAPKSAALAPKRTTLDKVTPVPVTRRTPSAELGNPDLGAPPIDRKTLLPKAAKTEKAIAQPPAN